MKPVKIVLYVVAVIAFTAPVLFWIYASAMACAFVTNTNACGVELSDFAVREFFEIAVIPWCLAAFCAFAAYRRGQETG